MLPDICRSEKQLLHKNNFYLNYFSTVFLYSISSVSTKAFCIHFSLVFSSDFSIVYSHLFHWFIIIIWYPYDWFQNLQRFKLAIHAAIFYWSSGHGRILEIKRLLVQIQAPPNVNFFTFIWCQSVLQFWKIEKLCGNVWVWPILTDS